MQQVLVMGAGKIGQLIAVWLADMGDFEVHLTDVTFGFTDSEYASLKRTLHLQTLDAKDAAAVSQYIQKHQIKTIISSLPFFVNKNMAQIALAENCHYFDLTEDVDVSDSIRKMAKNAKTTFASQCGLAPGFISILANDLMMGFEEIESVFLRVGALPEQANHALKYALTWSTEGLINEYANPCFGILNKAFGSFQPLEDLETIEIDGALYEAFNTSGGLGTLAKSYEKSVKNMNYKTLRYPGHCEKMRFLMLDLKLIEDRNSLKTILEKAIPRTLQDVVIVYVAVNGFKQGQYFEKTFAKKYYPKTIAGKQWSAIQTASAAAICAIVDIVLADPHRYQGVLLQENVLLNKVLENRFGRYFEESN